MKALPPLLLAVATSLPSSAVAFFFPTKRAFAPSAGGVRSTALPSRVSMRRNVARMASGDGGGAAGSPRPRRRRKDGKRFAPPSPVRPEDNGDGVAATAAALPVRNDDGNEAAATLPPPRENVVTASVRDVRDVVSGAPLIAVADGDSEGDKALADEEEWEYYDVGAD